MQKISHYWLLFKILCKGIFIRNNPFFIYLNKYRAKLFYKDKSVVEHRFCRPQKNNIALFSIAYNDHSLIQLQYDYIVRFLKDDFSYTIVDNSNDKHESFLLEQYCIDNKVNYIKLPYNPCTYSESHACALNYCYKNYIQYNDDIENFGFLDHDIIPYSECSIVKHMREGIYGLKISGGVRGKRRFMRGGFCFFNKQWENLDFWIDKTYFPLSILDTGGSNRYGIYQYIKDSSHLEKYNEFRDFVAGTTYNYRLVGDWIHFRGGNLDKNKRTYLSEKYFI